AWSFDPLTPGYAHASFPSGHATTVGALAILAMMAWPRHRAAIAVLMVLAGLTRVPALAHYPSDVAAGLFVGIAVTVAMARGAAARGLAGLRRREGEMLPFFNGTKPVGTRFWRT
ncbi:MAG: phosphatase PAP2 family protein, partial [Rhizobiaceae bacterium]